MFVIITDIMEDAIKRDLDKLRDSLPNEEHEAFEAERQHHRQAIIEHFAEFGKYPEIGGIELK